MKKKCSQCKKLIKIKKKIEELEDQNIKLRTILYKFRSQQINPTKEYEEVFIKEMENLFA